MKKTDETSDSSDEPITDKAQMPTDSGSISPAASSLIVSGTAWTNAAGMTTYSQKAPSYGGVAKNRMPGQRL